MVDWAKLLKCPPRQDTQCVADLAACKVDKATLAGQLKDANDSLSVLTGNLQTCNNNLGKAQKEYSDIIALSELLKHGPPPPSTDKMRWVSPQFIDSIMANALGARYTSCPTKLWSEGEYLVTTLDESQRFMDYFRMFWLPNISPYTQYKYKKLDGTEADLYARDCDDFADFFQGINALNQEWCSFPWGTIWAYVDSLFMKGGHAFNVVICCDDTYKETSVTGLKGYFLEPQQANGTWPVAGGIQQVVFKDISIGEVSGYPITDIYMVKF